METQSFALAEQPTGTPGIRSDLATLVRAAQKLPFVSPFVLSCVVWAGEQVSKHGAVWWRHAVCCTGTHLVIQLPLGLSEGGVLSRHLFVPRTVINALLEPADISGRWRILQATGYGQTVWSAGSPLYSLTMILTARLPHDSRPFTVAASLRPLLSGSSSVGQ